MNEKSAAEILALENQGRPPVQIWGAGAIVSSMHPQATQVAINILKQGGNAMDAAIGLGAAINVTNPDWCGLGGDSAWLVYSAKDHRFFYVDGYSKCPAKMTPEVLEKHFGLDPKNHPEAYKEEPAGYRDVGMITSMVPGTPALWVGIWERFGRLPFQTILEPAIDLAENGFPLNRYLAQQLYDKGRKKLGHFQSSRKIFLKPNGDVLGEGETLVQKDLAQTLKRLALGRRSEFYQGDTGRLIVDYSSGHGGIFAFEDFKQFDVSWRSTHVGNYRGYEIVTSGPPTSGAHLLQVMNILETFPLESMGYHSAESLHVMIEALKLARLDRRSFGGDPDFLHIPIQHLLDKNYALEISRLIQAGVARCLEPGQETTEDSTTHFVIRDKEGNIVSATQTLGSIFGCGEIVENTGILMNDRTWWMALHDGPNRVAPAHKANIGHSPVILLSRGRPFMALGSPGGDGIIQYVMQTIVNIIDYGFNIQEAIEAPRFRSIDLCSQVNMENRIDESVRLQLKRWGHQITDYPEWAPSVGAVEGFMENLETGNIMGGYDPRRNSMAMGI